MWNQVHANIGKSMLFCKDICIVKFLRHFQYNSVLSSIYSSRSCIVSDILFRDFKGASVAQ